MGVKTVNGRLNGTMGHSLHSIWLLNCVNIADEI